MNPPAVGRGGHQVHVDTHGAHRQERRSVRRRSEARGGAGLWQIEPRQGRGDRGKEAAPASDGVAQTTALSHRLRARVLAGWRGWSGRRRSRTAVDRPVESDSEVLCRVHLGPGTAVVPAYADLQAPVHHPGHLQAEHFPP